MNITTTTIAPTAVDRLAFLAMTEVMLSDDGAQRALQIYLAATENIMNDKLATAGYEPRKTRVTVKKTAKTKTNPEIVTTTTTLAPSWKGRATELIAARTHSDAKIAATLNEEGYKTPHGKKFRPNTVYIFRHNAKNKAN